MDKLGEMTTNPSPPLILNNNLLHFTDLAKLIITFLPTGGGPPGKKK